MKKVAFILFLLFLVLNVTAVMAQCPNCQGTGRIECTYCSGKEYVKPDIQNSGLQAWTDWTSEQIVFVRGTFQNNEDFGVYGRAIAEVDAVKQTYTNKSVRTYFPPQEKTTLTVEIEISEYTDYVFLSNQRYVMARLNIEVDDVTCSYCDGTGFITCPECGGDLIDGDAVDYDGDAVDYDGDAVDYDGDAVDYDGDYFDIDRGGREREQDVPVYLPLDLTLVGAGIVAAAIIGAIVVVRTRKVTEKDIRKLSRIELQNLVIKRLSGNAASVRDTRIGIDAYTADGSPIQIRQSDNVDRNVIENFASLMGRVKAKTGVIVAIGFADDAIRGLVRARMNYGVEIKKVTFKEIMEGRKIV